MENEAFSGNAVDDHAVAIPEGIELVELAQGLAAENTVGFASQQAAAGCVFVKHLHKGLRGRVLIEKLTRAGRLRFSSEMLSDRL
ncbi:hypothetical protein D9M68_637060 [compost metagenome]